METKWKSSRNSIHEARCVANIRGILCQFYTNDKLILYCFAHTVLHNNYSVQSKCCSVIFSMYKTQFNTKLASYIKIMSKTVIFNHTSEALNALPHLSYIFNKVLTTTYVIKHSTENFKLTRSYVIKQHKIVFSPCLTSWLQISEGRWTDNTLNYGLTVITSGASLHTNVFFKFRACWPVKR
jgi:hypothetical protein